MAKQRTGGLVYSTNTDFMRSSEPEAPSLTTLAKEAQKLRVKLDTKQRAGKVVTVVEGFSGKTADLDLLSKELKTKCGAGGSVKDGLILLQGDFRNKVMDWLKGWGYTGTK